MNTKLILSKFPNISSICKSILITEEKLYKMYVSRENRKQITFEINISNRKALIFFVFLDIQYLHLRKHHYFVCFFEITMKILYLMFQIFLKFVKSCLRCIYQTETTLSGDKTNYFDDNSDINKLPEKLMMHYFFGSLCCSLLIFLKVNIMLN